MASKSKSMMHRFDEFVGDVVLPVAASAAVVLTLMNLLLYLVRNP